MQTYQRREMPISIRVEAENVLLDIETAIPCGLLVNELVSNSLKHAFPGDRQGETVISLSCVQSRNALLVVSDNGVGFPANIDFRVTNTLGLKFANSLTQQLGGTITMKSDSGTQFEICFPLRTELQRASE